MTPQELRDWRKALDLTQVEAATIFDMTERGYAKLERGETLSITPRTQMAMHWLGLERYISRLKGEIATFNEMLEPLESGKITIGERRPSDPSWQDRTQAQIDHLKKTIAMFDGIIAHFDVKLRKELATKSPLMEDWSGSCEMEQPVVVAATQAEAIERAGEVGPIKVKIVDSVLVERPEKASKH
jgi:transcriptional regulator with XRE-family HTH domain